MSIDVVLQGERGNQIEFVGDTYGDLMKIWPLGETTFPLLQYLDEYGDTIFNCLQMNQLLDELESLKSRVNLERDLILIDRIKALAAKCKEGNCTYLRFKGD